MAHWTTAQQVKHQLAAMNIKKFVYLIQDFEPGFHQWSNNYVRWRAKPTNSISSLVFNEQFLRDYFAQVAIGRFRGSCLRPRQPGVRAGGRPGGVRSPCAGPYRAAPAAVLCLRPTNHRNLFGLGMRALRSIVTHPALAEGDWEFQAIGNAAACPTSISAMA